MRNKRSFAVIGGDLRQVKLIKSLVVDGYHVSVLGFNNVEIGIEVSNGQTIEEAVQDVDYIIAPLPCTVDDTTVNAPFCDEPICYKELFKCISDKQLLIGGKISEKIMNLAKIYNVFPIDYFDREELIVLNTIPTAEGAIQIAMEELPITLHNSRCLVLGFGRIGKVLSKMLAGIGAKVTVEARKHSDIAWVKSYGYQGIYLYEIGNYIGKFDIIFNTIPKVMLDQQTLSKISKECLVIDLASKPGGVDFEMARNLGVKAIWALSLPGKVASDTAGEIIKDTILNMIEELGV